MSAPAETPSRRYPTRLRAGSPLPPPPPPQSSARKKRKLSNAAADSVPSSPVPRSPVPPPSSPHTPAVQSNGARLCSLPSAKSCERTDPVAAGCSVPELPPSSSSLKDVPSASLGDLFAVYSYLRCFSRLLFLSPFSLEKFVTSLCAKCGDSLMDSVHFSLLEAVKRHALSTESSSFFGDMNWDLLDSVTWPVYLRSFLRTQGYSSVRKHSLVMAGFGKGEYQKKVSVAEKLAILSFLCDHALQNEESRKEVSVRLMAAHLGLIEPAGQRAGDGDSDFNPDGEHENKVKEVPLLRKVSDKLLKDTEKGEWSKEVQRAATALGGDGNSNDCMICGMDGVLICCDACPAAYHSRCVGATKGKLGSGDWFCPECRLPCTGIPYAKRLLGAVVLGIGPQERLFLATCDHLLVSDVSEGEEKYWYYGVSELFTVLKYLQDCGHGYHELQTNIRRHWGNDLMSLLGSSSEDLVVSKTPVSSTPKLRCQSERKEKKRKADVSEDSEVDTPAKKTPKTDSKSKTPKTPKMQPNPGPYVNYYSHGDAVATAADTLAAWQGGGDPAWEPGARVRGTSANEQVKAFTVSLPTFAWPSNRKLYSEKCGWCGLCSTNTRGCLLVQTHLQVSRQVDDLRPLKVSRGPRHLGTVTAYVLHLEEILHPLIEGGPWDFPLQRQKWRSRLEKNPSVPALGTALLQLEAYLRPITLSTDWVKHPDLAPMLFPACMHKNRQSLPWTPYKGVPPIRYCGAQWWRGGKMARLLCDWECLPRESLIKAARIGGGKAIPGLLYNDSNAVPQRSKQCAWRARVEASSSIAEIGLQVRYLDMQLKWKELLAEPVENATPFIFGKSKEEAVTKYLVAMTSEEIGAEKLKQESQPSVNQSVPSISSEGVRQIWKPEQQVPLSKVKLYEKENLGERGKKGNPAKKKIVWLSKSKTAGKRSLSSVLESLLASIISDEKKVEPSVKKFQTYSKSPIKPAAEKKPEPVIIRNQCNRCSADGDKVELSTVDGMLVCGQCHGKRPRKLSAKALAALSNEEVGSEESSPTEIENGKVLIKVESPPLKLEWSGTSLRKSGRKRKRVNLNAGAFAWIDAHDLSDNGSMKMETRTKVAQR